MPCYQVGWQWEPTKLIERKHLIMDMDMESEFEIGLTDMTTELMAGDIPGAPEDLAEVPDEPEMYPDMEITVAMLNRRPEIKKVFMDELGHLLADLQNVRSIGVAEGSDEPSAASRERFTDEQLVNALNSDPSIKTTALEVLTFITDCEEIEGEPYYRPSIFNTDDATYMQEVMGAGGFREERDEVPGRYDGLDEEDIALIYKNPECRQMLAKFKGPVTKELIRAMCKKK
jgi:hypothetical protein